MRSAMLKSSRIFLYLGCGLILLALLLLPTKTAVMIGVDLDYYWTGWLFAPVLGAWGIVSLAIWLSESSKSRGKVLQGLMLLCVPIYLCLAFAASILIYVRGNWFWLVFFSLILVPCVIVSGVAILFLRKKQRLVRVFQHPKVRIFPLSMLTAVPLLYTTIFLFPLYNVFS